MMNNKRKFNQKWFKKRKSKLERKSIQKLMIPR